MARMSVIFRLLGAELVFTLLDGATGRPCASSFCGVSFSRLAMAARPAAFFIILRRVVTLIPDLLFQKPNS